MCSIYSHSRRIFTVASIDEGITHLHLPKPNGKAILLSGARFFCFGTSNHVTTKPGDVREIRLVDKPVWT